jgi:hypothetical protein
LEFLDYADSAQDQELQNKKRHPNLIAAGRVALPKNRGPVIG